MGQVEDLLAVARAELGYREGSNNDNKYGRWYGMNNQPWCAMFVSWCAARAAIDAQQIPKMAYVPYMVDFYRQRGRYRAAANYTPRPGDIIFFGNSSHVGLAEKVSGGSVVSIEGNTSASGNSSNGDGVYRRTRALTNSWIMGYGSPEYKEDDEVDIKDLQIKNLDSGQLVQVLAVNVEGSNYIRLRDVEKLFPVRIDWDGSDPTLQLNYR